MDKLPRIAELKSIKMDLIPGIYNICTCGLSSSQPFCDSSHIGTEMKPFKLVVTENKRFSFCNCKHSKNMPFCDSYHKTLAIEIEEKKLHQNP